MTTPLRETTPFVPGPVVCAADFSLSDSSSGQPVMEAILDWFRPMRLAVVTATPQGSSDPTTDGTVKDTIRWAQTQGCWQPGSAEKLEIRPEGDRSWKNGLLHVTPDFNVETDSVVIVADVRYRVMDKKDFTVNGFIRYELLEDFEHARE